MKTTREAAEAIADQYAIQDDCVARRIKSPALFGDRWADGDHERYSATHDAIRAIIEPFSPDERNEIYAIASVIAEREN